MLSETRRVPRVALFLTAALLGAALLLGAWQGYRYERLLNAVNVREREQRLWHERNKQLIAAAAELRSPQRLAALAGADPELQRLTVERRIAVRLMAAAPAPAPAPASEEAGE
jgi:hypothetical protein